MREGNSLHETMIDRNWVLKRKRKRISSGLDASNGKESISLASDFPRSSSLAKLKADVDITRFSRKIKGHDGYFFECVECDLGGNLLCCDSCPRTYHLECLSPPLKRAPPGKWQCPSCCEQKDNAKSLSNAEANPKRARTKSTYEKSKIVHKLSGRDKALFFGRSSVLGKNKANKKGKAILSCKASSIEKKLDPSQVDTSYSTKSSPSRNSGSMDDISTAADSRNKKNPGSPFHWKTSSRKEIHSFIETLKSDASDKIFKGKADLHKSEMQGKKHLSLVQSTQISKKDNQKVQRDKKKRSRSQNGKHVATASSPTSKGSSLFPDTSGSLPKRKPPGQQNSVSIKKEEPRMLKISAKRRSETPRDEISLSLHALDEHGTDVDKTVKYHENLLDGVQQVDRILGCRVQTYSLMSPCHTQTVKSTVSSAFSKPENHSVSQASQSPSCDFTGLENHGKLLEDYHDGGNVLSIKDIRGVHNEGILSNETWVTEKGLDDNNAFAEEETQHAKESMDKDEVMTSATDLSKDHCITDGICKFPEESAVSAQVIGEETAEEGSEQNANVDLFSVQNCGNHHLPASHDSIVITEASMEAQLDVSAENKMPAQVVQESGPGDGNTVIFEFLVKWVGKSNIHNSWISESQLKILAKRKLENYKAKYGTTVINICEEQWCEPQRIIALRVSKDGTGEVLTKWRGLSYDECTWERLDEPVIEKSAHLVAEFKQFESKTLEKVVRDDIPMAKVDCQEVVSLTEQPKELQGGLLFPHQLEALNWLRKCWHKSKNVILADEMGLGKTVSACAFISSLYLEFKAKLPCLVLVPLSTMPNWLAEFSLWAPHLNVVEYHGPAKARSIIRQFEWHASDTDGLQKVATSYKFNVLLTTYEMVLADASHLRGVPWEILIVDEGHRLKNSGSKLFSLLNTISFQHRVLLTGTPLQNNIGEMYNLLNFLQPVSFPSLSAFEEKFNDLTTAEKVEELKKLVAPHMLRRLKKDAMQNIPPKTERMVPVELTSIQAEYYRAMLTKNYQILRNVGKGGVQQSMLNIVMQLRKVCNHPYLIPGTEPESGSIEFLQEMRIKASAKLTLLHSMLKILHKEGHRVLIFSQMTKLLDILEDYLIIEFGPKTYERVDGSVSVADRQAAIARFNQDKSRFVFLLSTRSCGLGINLASADTVIIYDSDFNPHADIQAMNRAHRIGQSNRLLVYRLVVRASVEERILQLAKKKLMLDQLFVNKSESQKEVEDILRWGTEELFNDLDGVNGQDLKETSSNKLETVADGEHRHRRRSGGLGDVYKDRCTDGSTKIVWDENAISKLLDRSNVQSVFESTDGDLENDMLGSVKSLDWNDELSEEPAVAELPPSTAGDGCELSSEVKEDNAINSTEENEWDRLLRVRWEKYQIEEEAALGRGKRLRKAVSYKETFASIPSEVLSESGNDEEEPEPVYTPAGRALKDKYAKLRARQKERIAHRNNVENPCPAETSELSKQLPVPSVNEGQSLDTSQHLEDGNRQNASPVKMEETRLSQPFQAKRTDFIPRVGRFSKNGHKRFQNSLDLSVYPSGNLPPEIFLPSHQFQRPGSANPVSSTNLLPVLGLCAPNATQMNLASRNFHSHVSQPSSDPDQRRVSTGISEFPFPPTASAGPSNDPTTAAPELITDPSLLPDISREALQHRLKNFIPNNVFPFCPPPSTTSGRGLIDNLESSGASFSSFQERLGLPNLTLDDKPLPKFPLSSKNAIKPHTDLLPSLSLGSNIEFMNGSSQDFPNIPPLPNFTQQLSDALKQRQHVADLPPMLGLGHVQSSHSSLPENHKKVLDNIMMRTQSTTNKFLKKRLKVDSWSEDELDALWIGVRRHGRGNWDAMLRDPKLRFSKHRTGEDLFIRWAEEQRKIIDGPPFTGPVSSKSASFPGIPDGMMSRALIGSNFVSIGPEPSKFRSHLTDIKLACGDFTSGFPFIDPTNHLGTVKESCPPLPAWQHNQLGSSFPGDFSAVPFDRLEKMNFPLDRPFLHHTFPGTSFGSLSSNFSSSCNVQIDQGESCANKISKLPSFLDKSLNLLRDAHNNIHSDEYNTKIPLDLKKKQISDKSPMDDDNIVDSSKANNLPHWLREAVNIPPSKPPESHLPPTVSAIAQSVRLLYGEEKPTIPPFSIPGPPPLQPKDPRKSLKKKRKSHKLLQAPEMVSCIKTFDHASSSTAAPPSMLEITASIKAFDHASSSTIPPAPPSITSAPDCLKTEPSPSLPSLNLNLNSPSSSSFDTQVKKSCVALSPSSEVLQLVGTCVAFAPCTSSAPEMPSPSYQRTEPPVPVDFENFEQDEKGAAIRDLKDMQAKRKEKRNLLLGCQGKLKDKQMEQVESENSSKTQSGSCGANPVDVEEISSEDTVSNDHKSEFES